MSVGRADAANVGSHVGIEVTPEEIGAPEFVVRAEVERERAPDLARASSERTNEVPTPRR